MSNIIERIAIKIIQGEYITAYEIVKEKLLNDTNADYYDDATELLDLLKIVEIHMNRIDLLLEEIEIKYR